MAKVLARSIAIAIVVVAATAAAAGERLFLAHATTCGRPSLSPTLEKAP